MVGLSVVSENSLNIMPRSKPSVNVKVTSQRRGSLQPRSPYFWNTPFSGQETPRKSTSNGKSGTPGRLSYRRKSTGETYKIYDIGENGIRNIQLIEMTENEDINGRQSNHTLPPISSLRNPRLSATSSARSDKKRPKRSSTTIGGSRHSSNYSKSNKSVSNTSHKLLLTERSNTENFCHGLPRTGNEDNSNSFIDSNEPMTSRTTIASSIRRKLEETKPLLSHRGIVGPRASSLRSQPSSSDGSINNAAFRARMAPRRSSLPVTPNIPQSLLARKGKDSSKGIELPFGAHQSTGDKKSPKTRSLLTSSEKLSSPASSIVLREAREPPVTTHGDGLHIIEETPAEPSTPVLTTLWDKPSDAKENINIVTILGDKETDTASNKTSKLSNTMSLNIASDDYKNVLSSLTNPEQNQTPRIEDIPEIAVTPSLETHEGNAPNKDVTQPDINNNNGVNSSPTPSPILLATQKAELLTSSSMLSDDVSLIDATILNEQDEDLCDADFREKRIIQWIIAAETGHNVDQQVESAISPSPTNGSRETAITVIYGE